MHSYKSATSCILRIRHSNYHKVNNPIATKTNSKVDEKIIRVIIFNLAKADLYEIKEHGTHRTLRKLIVFICSSYLDICMNGFSVSNEFKNKVKTL